jgi:hypothetical protein
MIGFENINRYKVLFLALLWLGYGTGCISSPPEIPSQTENENPPEIPPEIPSQTSSESTSQSSSQTPSKDSSENISQSSTLTSPETSSEKLPESISQSSPKSPSQTSSEGSPQTSSKANSQNLDEASPQKKQQSGSESSTQIASESPSQTASEGPSESASQGKSQPLPEDTSERASQSSSQTSSEGSSQTSSEGSSQTSSEQSALQELESRLELARKDLRISEAAEARIASGLEQLKNSGNASPETLEDYETYLSRAREMVAENRKTVEELEALHARYATAASRPSALTDARKVSNPKLPDEKEYDELGKLDRKLDHSLAAFDELLLRELDEIQDKSAEKMRDLAAEAAAAAQRLEEQGVSVDPSSTEAASGSQESARESEQSEGSPEKGEEGGIQSETAGNRQKGSKGAVGGQSSVQEQRSRPSGHDDDIVARQIREAAEKETDPELKEKLWKEYEDYKKGNR